MTVVLESSPSYEAADGSELPMLIFEPDEGTPALAGIVLFHGGGLHNGSPEWLASHCRQLASRGIFAASAGYRLIGHGAVSIADCIADVRRAIACFSGLAAVRGLDSSRLASGGASAGADLALMSAMAAPDRPVPAPGPGTAAVAALYPLVDLLSYSPEQRQALEQGTGVAAGRLGEYSPAEFVRPGNPPVLIQHGTDDKVAPIGQIRRFRDTMARAGNDCVLLEYEGAGHGFDSSPGGHFDSVIDAVAEFLLDRLAAG